MTMDASRTHVVIAGAGIGGMAAAVLAARVGASVTLLERAPDIRAVGAGILLQPNGLAVLSGLGLDARLRARGCAMAAATVHGADGSVLTDLRVPPFGPGLDRHLAVRRSVVHEVLHDAVTAEPAIETRLATTVTAAEPAGVVVTADGDRVRGDLVVGADGVHSAVRRTGGFAARDRSGHVYVRGLVPAGGDLVPGESWTALGLFGGAPVDDRTWYFYASASAPEVRTAVDARDLDALRRAWEPVSATAAQVLGRVESFDDLLVNDVVRVDCARWYHERLVLLGDAAHAMSPTAGQGANSALVDAAVLVAGLVAAPTIEDALAGYDRRRRAAVARIQNRADLLARLSHVRSPLARRLRDAALYAAGRGQGGERAVRAGQQVDPAALRSMVETLTRAGR